MVSRNNFSLFYRQKANENEYTEIPSSNQYRLLTVFYYRRT